MHRHDQSNHRQYKDQTDLLVSCLQQNPVNLHRSCKKIQIGEPERTETAPQPPHVTSPKKRVNRNHQKTRKKKFLDRPNVEEDKCQTSSVFDKVLCRSFLPCHYRRIINYSTLRFTNRLMASTRIHPTNINREA